MSPIRVLLATALAAAATLALAGCAPAVALEPAADANNPQCAEVTVRLPDAVAELPERGTDAQATGAWGDPATVLLHCGVAIPGPTTQQCQSVNGVDWIIDESEAPRYRVTTFGRTPAVEVYLDNDLVSSAAVLDTLSRVVSILPTDGSACTDAETAP